MKLKMKYNPLNLLPKIVPPSMVPTVKHWPLRIAVSGLSGAGKTAFLTSLIAQLKQHSPKRFALSNPESVITAKTVTNRSGCDWRQFPFDQNFAGFVNHGSWPEKTTDCTQYTLELDASRWWVSGCRLTLYDVPGERFTDSAMMQKSFAEWSAHQIQWLGTASQVSNGRSVTPRCAANMPHVQEYLRLMETRGEHSLAESAIVSAYKLALGDLVKNYHSYASPSLFLLDQQGRAVVDELVRARAVELPEEFKRVVASRTTGLLGEEFAPLSPQAAAEFPELANSFQQRYDKYRAAIVEPIFKQLTRCHGMVVLVDIADILAGGPPLLWDTDHFLMEVFDAIRPGGNISRAVLAKFGMANYMRRVALVAGQCDRFHADDYEHLRELVEKLAKAQLDKIAGLKHECFHCAAVCSTSDDRDGKLRGLLYREGEGMPEEEESYEVDRLPSEWFGGEYEQGWPNHWDVAAVSHIPRVWPKLPKVHKAVPDHIDLDKVFRFVTRW